MLNPVSGYSSKGDPKEEHPKKEKSEEKKTENTEDSLNIYESENKVLDRVEIPAYKDNSSKRDKAKKSSSETYSRDTSDDEIEDDDPNSAMSFNIIYYIIDKFKFTDPLQ
ncbi:MAG: hypothetical protein ABFS32_11380 [Bacteroidota bacterium]